MDYAAYQKVHAKFQCWLAERGAEVLVPTNEWEVLRFKTNRATSIIYRNAQGRLTFGGESSEAYRAFVYNQPWRGADATKRVQRSGPVCLALRARDGDLCFFCQQHVAVEDESVEHLVSITHGGPDHIANKALAHKKCNQDAGYLSLMGKINRHVEARLKLRMDSFVTAWFPNPDNRPPWEEA